LSSLGLSGSISNKTFVVDADLIIDVSAYFTNCLFKVAPGKSIHVKALGYCVFFTSTLYSCGGRWQGIDIIDNNAFLDISFSTIQNAVAGVQISSKTSTNISIYHNDFYNNHVGIYILGNTSFASNFTFGNKFHGSMVAFKPGFTVPFQTLPAYGIRIEGVGYYALNCNVGNFFADAQIFAEPNEFYNLYVSGIYCDVAQTEVRGALFYDFFKIPDWYPFSYAPVMGVGITNYSSDLVVSNYNTDPYPPIEFRNLEYGYYAKNYQGGSWTLVEGARFSACASSAMYGSFASPSASFTALRDTFTQIRKTTHTFFTPTKKYNGIYMDGTTQIYDFSNNVFTSYAEPGLLPVAHYQLYMNGLGAGGPNHPTFGTIFSNIFNNSMQHSNSLYIANHYGKGGVVFNNTFNYAPDPSGLTPWLDWQAAFLDDRNLTVKLNVFNDAHSTDNIHCQGNNEVLFCQNDLIKSQLQGFHAIYNNNIDLAKTHFGNHYQGLYLEKTDGIEPIIGLQYHKENCWDNMDLGADAHNEASTTLLVQQSLFTADPSIASCFYPATLIPFYWFDPAFQPEPNQCELQQVPHLILEQNYEDLTWESKYEWYRTIQSRGALNDWETDFMTYATQTGIPVLSDLETQINDLLTLSADKQDELITLRSSIKGKIKTIEDKIYPYGNVRPSRRFHSNRKFVNPSG